MECLPNSLVQLVVGDGAPEGRLTVSDWLEVCGDTGRARSAGQTLQCARDELLRVWRRP